MNTMLKKNIKARDINCSLPNAMVIVWRFSRHALPQGVKVCPYFISRSVQMVF